MATPPDFDQLRALAKDNLSVYASLMHPDWNPNWHHRVIANVMQRVAQAAAGDDTYAKYRRVCIQMPPRAGKTELISKMFPGWYMAKNPYHNIINASYGAELADDIGRKAREYVMSDTFASLFETPVSKLTNALTKWELTNHSRFFATSVGAALTGFGANCLLVDDPIKNQEDANSTATKDRIWDWFMSTAYTRLEKNGVVVVIMTRWAEDDLIGRLLPSGKWMNISFPMIAEKDERYRKKDEPLWPDKYDLEKCEEIKTQVGKRVWASLYQQRPAPDEGAIFLKEYLRWYEPDDLDRLYFTGIYQSWDTGVSGKVTSARSACTTWGVVHDSTVPGGSKFYLLDVFADQLSFPELRAKARQMIGAWGPDLVWVEEQQTGRPLLDELRLVLGTKLKGVRPVGTKENRARAVSAAFEGGRVFIPKNQPWVDAYVNELATFPYGAYADKVDSTTQALRQMMRAEYSDGRRNVRMGYNDILQEPRAPSVFWR